MRESGINQGSTEICWKTLKGFKQGSDNWVYTFKSLFCPY